MRNSYLQQGDVLLFQRNKLPKDIKKLDTKTVAYGEHTGHHHTFYGDEDGVELFEDTNKIMWALITKPMMLKHQEHKEIPFQPGVYEIGIVREYDHIKELERKVID